MSDQRHDDTQNLPTLTEVPEEDTTVIDTFTLGPWQQVSPWRVCNVSADGREIKVICDTGTNQASRTIENAANARLIAAAPELLEALKELYGMTKTNILSPYPNAWDKRTNDAVAKAGLAIEKAEGRNG